MVSFAVTAAAQQSASGEVSEKCTYPQQPSIPNGTKADMDEMLAAQSAVKKYQASAQEFRTCIDGIMAEWDNLSESDQAMNEEKKSVAINFYNRSVADEEEVANMFNRAREAFMAKRK